MTTALSRSRSPRYNQRKKQALEIFARHGGWLTPPEWAVLARFYPIRSAYSYLLRLHKFGLLERRSLFREVSYRLADRGNERLVWLQEMHGT